MKETTGVHKVYRKDNQPFAQIPNEAIRNPNLSASAFRLLAYLMSHQDGYELTYGQIERETGLGRYAINQAIGNLTAEGWLLTERTKMPNGQYGPKSWTVLTPTTVGNSTAGDSTVEYPTDNKKTTTKEHKEKEQVIPQAELEEAFNEFWNAYPRKVEKIAAKKAFIKAAKQHGTSALIAGARRLAADRNAPAKQFIRYPASWLNAGGWTDEPYPERARTKEELAAEAKMLAEQRRQRAQAEHERLMAEAKKAKEEAEANPPQLCEHNRVAVICQKCQRAKLG